MTQWALSQDCKGSSKLRKAISVVRLNRMKWGKKKHKVIQIDTEKAFDKIQHSFMIKILSKLRREGGLSFTRGHL